MELVEIFKTLLRFNTANPPGNEKPAIHYIKQLLEKEGLQPIVIDSDTNRANLVVRIKGTGNEMPLLLNSHIDVVHVEEEKWKHPPFAAVEAEGCIWGRGAVDMKNMTAYCLGILIEMQRKKTVPKRDLIVTVVADEEVGGDFGMGFLVKKHRELIECEYAIGELGGFTLHIGGKKFYPIQAGEKGIFWIKVFFGGDPGHGSIPKPENVHFELARFLNCLSTKTLPQHLTPVSSAFFSGLMGAFGAQGVVGNLLLQNSLSPKLMKFLSGKLKDTDQISAMLAMQTNTLNPTGIESGHNHNVVPSQVSLKLDCRLVPGFAGTDVIQEVEELWGKKLRYEVVREELGFESPTDSTLYKLMAQKVLEKEPDAHVIPQLTVGFTDAQHLKKLGAKCYGFTPIQLPEGMSYPKLYHGHNERIPVEGFMWGYQVLKEVVFEFLSR